MKQVSDHLSGPTQRGSGKVFLGELYSLKAETIALVDMIVTEMNMLNDAKDVY